jgi:hypothetical protein
MSPSHAPDAEQRQPAQELPVSELNKKLPPRRGERLPDQTAQCCFLCLQGEKHGHYAVQVPYSRATPSPRGARRTRQRSVNKDRDARADPVVHEKRDSRENAGESDAAIYERLNEMCFRYQGRWRKWIPLYGVTDVREVEVGRQCGGVFVALADGGSAVNAAWKSGRGGAHPDPRGPH